MRPNEVLSKVAAQSLGKKAVSDKFGHVVLAAPGLAVKAEDQGLLGAAILSDASQVRLESRCDDLSSDVLAEDVVVKRLFEIGDVVLDPRCGAAFRPGPGPAAKLGANVTIAENGGHASREAAGQRIQALNTGLVRQQHNQQLKGQN